LPERTSDRGPNGDFIILDMAGSLVQRALRVVSRERLRFLVRTWRLTLPYALRSVKRRRWRAAALVCCATSTVLVIVVFSSFLAGSTARLAGRYKDSSIADDFLFFAPGFTATETARAGVIPALGHLETALLCSAQTSAGDVSVMGVSGEWLSSELDSNRTKRGLTWVRGRPPEGSGEAALPAELASQVGLSCGTTLEIQIIDAEHRLHRHALRVVGWFLTDDPLLTGVLTTLEQAAQLAPSQGGENTGNLLLCWWKPGTDRAGARDMLRGIIKRGRWLNPGDGRDLAGRLFRDIFSPGRLILLLACTFSALGIFNAILLSMLERRRDVGVLKAIGMESRELEFLFIQEGYVMGLVGSALGVLLSGFVVRLLNAYTPYAYTITPVSVAVALAAAWAVFYLGSVLPAGLTRRVTVVDLLQNRGII